MITIKQLLSTNAFLAIAASDALELLADKSKYSYDELFEMFKAGHEGLVSEVVKMVLFAAQLMVKDINGVEA